MIRTKQLLSRSVLSWWRGLKEFSIVWFF